MQELPQNYHQALVMHHMGHSHAEIADALELSSSDAARKLVSRGHRGDATKSSHDLKVTFNRKTKSIAQWLERNSRRVPLSFVRFFLLSAHECSLF